MKYQKMTGKSIQQAFEEFHKENPKVYDLFKRYALIAIKKGKKKVSFKLIMNVIRWDVYIKTFDRNRFSIRVWRYGKKTEIDTFKINDAYGSRYARLFVKDFPEFSDRIELRELRS
jgi:hypothetical protein